MLAVNWFVSFLLSKKKVILSCFAGCSRFWLRRRSATSDSLAPNEKEGTVLTKKGFSRREEEEEETTRRAKTKKKTEEEDSSRFVINDKDYFNDNIEV